MTIFTTGSLITAAGAQQLESSFAGASSPASPVTGQLWYDIPNAVLKVFSGSSWEKVSGSTVTVSETPPAGPAAGSLWFNVGDTVARMFVWSGTVWVDTNPSGSAIGGSSIQGIWNNKTSSRSQNTTYTNTLPYPIVVSWWGDGSSGGNNYTVIYINGTVTGSNTGAANVGWRGGLQFIVPANSTYSISGNAGVGGWWEMY